MVHKVNDKNFLKIDHLLSKIFTQNFKERYHHKRRESQVSNLKDSLREEAPTEKSAKNMGLYKSFDFSEGFIGVAKIASSLECRFLLGQGESTP